VVLAWLQLRGRQRLDEALVLHHEQALDHRVGRDEARMIRIAITQAAFDAIAATMLFGKRELRDEDQRQGRAADSGSMSASLTGCASCAARRELQRCLLRLAA
jgi:hypothetical protein